MDDDAPPGGNGTSWNTAFRDLQDALAVVNSTPWSEVRIARGTYRPDRGTASRQATFGIECAPTASSVTVWFQGGFAGRGAPNPDLRDPETFVTVLSGDLRGDDAPGFANRADNALHVVTVRQRGRHFADVTLDGLTVRAGNANQGLDVHGGGVFMPDPSVEPTVMTLSACRIIDNEASGDGGGLFDGEGEVRLSRCSVRGNRTGGAGGGVHAQSLSAEDSLIADNTAGSGGGLCVGSSYAMVRCTIAGNRALSGPGGGVLAAYSARLENCRVTTNSSAHQGGGIAVGSTWGMLEISHCTVTNNSASLGGGFWVQPGYGGTLVESSILWNNAAAVGAQGYAYIQQGRLQVNRSDVQGGESGVWTTPGALLWRSTNIAQNPGFADGDGPDNILATWDDNDERLGFASPCIDRASVIDDFFYRDLDNHSGAVNSRGYCQERPDIGAYEYRGASTPAPIPRLYVRAGALPGGNGRTWASAFQTVQEAIQTPGVREVWVAAGQYTPGPAYDDLLSHEIGCPLTLLGGFAGDETSASQSDPVAHPTILSGQGTQRVLSMMSGNLTLDGFTITRGFSPRYGEASGLDAYGGSATLTRCQWIDNGSGTIGMTQPGMSTIGTWFTSLAVTDCEFVHNTASDDGAAIRAERGDTTIRRTDFFGNTALSAAGAVYIRASTDDDVLMEACIFGGNESAERGGALVMDCSQPEPVRDCLFVQNRSGPYQGRGGALYARSVNVENCWFLGNAASESPSHGNARALGGAAFTGRDAAFINCFFSGNRAADAGGLAAGGALAAEGPTTLMNCTLVGNSADSAWGADSAGGGVWIHQAGGEVTASLTASNSILWANWVRGGGGSEAAQIAALPSEVTIDHCVVMGWTGSFGGVANSGVAPRLHLPAGPDGSPGTLDDDPTLSAFSPCIDAGRNSAVPAGITKDALGNPRFVDDPGVANTGSGTGAIVDLGAAESQVASCDADCNADGVLTLADFGCFQTRYVLGDQRADCNQDRLLNLSDFGCFSTKFALGCP